MNKSHIVTALLAFGSLAALPSCSSWNTGQSSSGSAAAAPMPSPELSSNMVMQVQTALQQQGVYKGSIDGLWGPQTQGAVQSYQQAHGLTANGQLDAPTLASLNVGNTGGSTTPPQASNTSAPMQSNGTPAPMQSNGTPAPMQSTANAAPSPTMPAPATSAAPNPTATQ